MTYDEIRQKMINYYENDVTVDNWLNKVNPHSAFQNYSPKEIFNMQDNPDAIKFGEDFVKWLEQQK